MYDDPRYDPLSWILMAAVFVTVAVLLLVTPARGEETVLAESTVAQGGLICDTQAEVATFITQTEAGTDPQAALNAIDGCGILLRPMRIRVTAVDTVKTEKFSYLIVRYDFLDVPSPPQFGIAQRKSAGIGI